jgi:O-antigen/teichoic acid export membrane protein
VTAPVSSHSASKHGVGGQAVFLAGATGFSQLLVALIYLFAARGSDPSTFGLAVAAIALGTAAAGFIDFGTNAHWVREVARGHMERVELGGRLSGKLFVALAVGVAWAAVSALLFPGAQLWTAAPIMCSILISQTSQVPLRGAARGDLVAISIVVDRAIAAGVFFALIALGAAPSSALWIALVAGALASTTASWCLVEKSLRPSPSLRLRGNPWSGSGFFGWAAVANNAQALDLPLLSLIGGPAGAGLYGAVNRWTQPMTLLASSFASAAAPFVSRSPNIVVAWRHLRKGVWLPLAAIAVSIVVFVLAPWIVQPLLGDAYEGSVDVLRILALVSILSIISQPAMVALQALGRDRYVALVMIGSVGFQLAAVGVLAPGLGAVGAAWASLSAQLILVLAFASAARIEFRRAQSALRYSDTVVQRVRAEA